MNVVIIIQARMGSTRLPGKILLPLGKQEVLTYVTERCNHVEGVKDVIVATSTLEQDDSIEAWCHKHNIECFRGSEEDVLSRYTECAKLYEPDYVIRVTSDCPFVDFEMASEMVALMEKEKKDIVTLDGDLPRGLAVEIISFDTLLKIERLGKEPRHREHVTYYAYEYPENFKTIKYQVPLNRKFPELRITLDTEEDYHLIRNVAEHFNDPLVSSVKVIEYLRDNPQIAKLNTHIQQKPVI